MKFPKAYFILFHKGHPMFCFCFHTEDYDKAYLWMEGYVIGLGKDSFVFDDVPDNYTHGLLTVIPW